MPLPAPANQAPNTVAPPPPPQTDIVLSTPDCCIIEPGGSRGLEAATADYFANFKICNRPNAGELPIIKPYNQVVTIAKFSLLVEARREYRGVTGQTLDDKCVLFLEDVIAILDRLREKYGHT